MQDISGKGHEAINTSAQVVWAKRRCYTAQAQKTSRRRNPLPACLLTAMLAVCSLTSVAQNTTLAEQSGNNTSAADSFTTSANGNITPGNISKVPLRNLLYEGATTKIYAHFVGWFGGRDHIDIGYQSSDPLQVKKQVADMISRGIDGAIVDWYGPMTTNRSATSRNTELATQALMNEAEQAPGFEFAIMVDKGALHRCEHDCNPTAELIRQMTYIHDTYEKSPAYMRVNGRPVVLFFGVAQRYNIDWKRVVKQVPGDPILVFQDAMGFGNPLSNSGYAWVKLDPERRRDWMDRYLHYFYSAWKLQKDANAIGAVYKGFDDSMASWSEKRVMSQDCGRTWLNTWAEIAKEHSATEPLGALQLVTWNDYEEGTEIETGIDNCADIHAWRDGSALRWNVRWSQAKAEDLKKNGPDDAANDGQDHRGRRDAVQINDTPEAGIDHYAVFLSTDQQNLTQVGEVQTGNSTFDFASLQLSPGKYYMYVQAVGKPGLLNHLSHPITIHIAPPQR